mmetsp:Transcript_31962/g.76170  ORF Transcript_31962/g.76170 Transcript_31962/m.76170 type:complete len:423 (+) Transcript_31962:1445-2713(+)
MARLQVLAFLHHALALALGRHRSRGLPLAAAFGLGALNDLTESHGRDCHLLVQQAVLLERQVPHLDRGQTHLAHAHRLRVPVPRHHLAVLRTVVADHAPAVPTVVLGLAFARGRRAPLEAREALCAKAPEHGGLPVDRLHSLHSSVPQMARKAPHVWTLHVADSPEPGVQHSQRVCKLPRRSDVVRVLHVPGIGLRHGLHALAGHAEAHEDLGDRLRQSHGLQGLRCDVQGRVGQVSLPQAPAGDVQGGLCAGEVQHARLLLLTNERTHGAQSEPALVHVDHRVVSAQFAHQALQRSRSVTLHAHARDDDILPGAEAVLPTCTDHQRAVPDEALQWHRGLGDAEGPVDLVHLLHLLSTPQDPGGHLLLRLDQRFAGLLGLTQLLFAPLVVEISLVEPQGVDLRVLHHIPALRLHVAGAACPQ